MPTKTPAAEKPKKRATARRKQTLVEVTPDAIAARAYELYAAGVEGDQLAHWLMAEEELSAAKAA